MPSTLATAILVPRTSTAFTSPGGISLVLMVVTASPAPLADVGERDRQLAEAFLDLQIAEHESRHFQRGNPSLAVGEAVFERDCA